MNRPSQELKFLGSLVEQDNKLNLEGDNEATNTQEEKDDWERNTEEDLPVEEEDFTKIGTKWRLLSEIEDEIMVFSTANCSILWVFQFCRNFGRLKKKRSEWWVAIIIVKFGFRG